MFISGIPHYHQCCQPSLPYPGYSLMISYYHTSFDSSQANVLLSTPLLSTTVIFQLLFPLSPSHPNHHVICPTDTNRKVIVKLYKFACVSFFFLIFWSCHHDFNSVAHIRYFLRRKVASF